MPPQQGEVSLLTLFADAHYYFSPPTYNPPHLHHRFDKGSYVYLYHSPIQQRGRIEIANHAGTPEQDAFAGQLDSVKVAQSYKHPCLFTITVDAFKSQAGSPAQSPQQDLSQWHLAAHDLTNQGKYMYRLHTVDLYFWTQDDATMFLDSLRRVVQPHQLQIVPNPHATPTHAEHKHDTMNPVVAKLEKAAISHSSRSPSISTTQSFPGPPSAPAPASSPPQDAHYTPMAYNPAAPAAPEPIAHREKTPPPADAADGTGLGTAAMNDHHHAQQQYGNPMQASFAPQSTSSQPYVPGPPAPGQGFTGPPAPGVQRVNTSGTLPPPPQSPPAFAPPPASAPPQAALQTGQSPVPSPTYAPGPPQQYQPMASPPPGGYAQFQYGSTSQASPYNNNLHQQLHRPTEQEAGVQDNEVAPQRNSNIGRRAEKMEKGVNRLFKKLDKKF